MNRRLGFGLLVGCLVVTLVGGAATSRASGAGGSLRRRLSDPRRPGYR